MDTPRLIPPSGRVFTRNDEAERSDIVHVEGRPLGTPVELRQMMVTPRMVMVETRFSPGQASLPHDHPDHDSIVYVVSGKVRVTIAGREFIANTGDAWYNEPGVVHHIEALEPTTAIEVKSPPIKAW